VVWDPEGTLGRALWIGGGQWAGKSTVSRILARRYGLTVLDYDFQDERAHQDRRVVDRLRRGLPPPQPYPHEHWVTADPEAMAAEALADFRIRFNWLLDDLRSLYSPRPIIAEGWALRPELVAPILDSPRRMVVLVPTEEWRQKQLLALPRAAARVRQPVTLSRRSATGWPGTGWWRRTPCVTRTPTAFGSSRWTDRSTPKASRTSSPTTSARTCRRRSRPAPTGPRRPRNRSPEPADATAVRG